MKSNILVIPKYVLAMSSFWYNFYQNGFCIVIFQKMLLFPD